MNNPTDLKSMLSYWSEVKYYLLNLTSEDMLSEDNIKKSTNILSYYFSPFIIELLSDKNKSKLVDYLLEIRAYFINKKNYTLSAEHCKEVDKLVTELKSYFNEIGGNIPNLAILEQYENAIRKQQKDIELRASEQLGELTTQSIKKPFSEQATKYLWLNWFYTLLFYALLVALFFILKDTLSAITFVLSSGESEIKFNDFITKIIIIMPFIWAILLTAKKANESTKLRQVYLHKTVIAQSYLNYLEFINNNYHSISTGNINPHYEVINTLHKVAMESLALNPALLLDKSTAEKIPMEELLSRILDKTTTTKKGE
ncbi:hypothetical protein [Avibacterium paragallinarum]|uniref:Uncharacterized protein n=1 Tax=Avibacterium paragallinarum TaxID=728 RepID=A0A8B3TAH4_AVIPA|nr:hypothetical protein [Avibacterium paragallinarum]RZN59583.1 hypothetical protein EIG79_05840 [Avibacterium paragallinarum]